MLKNNSFYIRWKYEICKPPHASVSNSHFGYNAVIPAWMQESSHRDVKPQVCDGLAVTRSLPSLDAGFRHP